MHPTPCLFQKFHNHPRLPSNLAQTNLSPTAIQTVDYALQHGWAEATLANYGNTMDRFIAFCTTEGVPSDLQLPADEFVLCAFAASGAGVHASSTARNNIAALKAWHVVQGIEWRGGSRLHYVLTGVEKLAPESSKRPPRPPINATMLRILYEGLDLSDPRDIAVFAAACVAFWGQCRLGELLPNSRLPTASKFLPTRNNISRSPRNKRSTTIRLPRTKTKINGEDVVLVTQSAPIDPRVALEMHLLANKGDPSSTLFTYITNTGPTILTKSKFLQRCNEIWDKAGYPHTTGHSFRISGTTELLLAGVAPDVVKAMGRWSSDAFHKYWRSLEDLAPIHAELITT
ncbi:DNA breaking-rejoining enzyme [Mycena galopus ATCC 62051]|nr:DNA breaking-rejoining enzyme [Mycena galopus ATCC 62051]